MDDIKLLRKLLYRLSRIVYLVRIQDYTGAKNDLRKVFAELNNESDYLQMLSETYSMQAVTTTLNEINDAMTVGDMILVADIVEANVMPAVATLCNNSEVISEGRYCIEPTLSGYLTIKDNISGIYIHSNNDPVAEARLFVEKSFSPLMREYAVWGVGLGYHVEQLFWKAEGALTIKVYDEDPEMIRMAGKYGIYADIPSERISLIEDPTGKKFADEISSVNCGILIHLPSLEKIQNKGLYDALWSFFLKVNGYSQLKDSLAVNFRENLFNCKKNVSELRNQFSGREIVIVAGGPSLDDNVGFLRDSRRKGRMILSVTTVLKRLIEYGIVPDYTVIQCH